MDGVLWYVKRENDYAANPHRKNQIFLCNFNLFFMNLIQVPYNVASFYEKK